MSRRGVRKGGPYGVARPFAPSAGFTEPLDEICEALDHIATALSAIDHNFEMLIGRMETNSATLARIAAAIERTAR
jgi:hypothetical protein